MEIKIQKLHIQPFCLELNKLNGRTMTVQRFYAIGISARVHKVQWSKNPEVL